MSEFYINGIDHVGVPVSNLEKSIEFYIGLGFIKKYQPENRRCAFMENNGSLIELFEREVTPKMDGAINHIALYTNDVVSAYKYALNNGYNIVSNKIQYLPFWGTGVSFFIITGPDNERIELAQKGKFDDLV